VPELPEVETIRRQLAPGLEGRRIDGVEVRDPRWCEPAPPEALEDALRGRLIERVGKYLIVSLEDDVHLVMHLRMTGNLLLTADADDPPHLRVAIELDDGRRLLFVDGGLRRPQIEALRSAVMDALQLGIDSKGASIDDYRHVDGARGSFQDRFLVYSREGEPCVRCGTAIVKLRAAGRGTYICPNCQRAPRIRSGRSSPRALHARGSS
jgi:formamidopyrimidine-DNA glycosylase